MNWEKRLTIEQLDDSIKSLPKVERIPRFKTGWIKTIRTALGVSTQLLGDRIGVSQPQISKLENSEADMAITLRSLKVSVQPHHLLFKSISPQAVVFFNRIHQCKLRTNDALFGQSILRRAPKASYLDTHHSVELIGHPSQRGANWTPISVVVSQSMLRV